MSQQIPQTFLIRIVIYFFLEQWLIKIEPLNRQLHRTIFLRLFWKKSFHHLSWSVLFQNDRKYLVYFVRNDISLRILCGVPFHLSFFLLFFRNLFCFELFLRFSLLIFSNYFRRFFLWWGRFMLPFFGLLFFKLMSFAENVYICWITWNSWVFLIFDLELTGVSGLSQIFELIWEEGQICGWGGKKWREIWIMMGIIKKEERM